MCSPPPHVAHSMIAARVRAAPDAAGNDLVSAANVKPTVKRVPVATSITRVSTCDAGFEDAAAGRGATSMRRHVARELCVSVSLTMSCAAGSKCREVRLLLRVRLFVERAAGALVHLLLNTCGEAEQWGS